MRSTENTSRPVVSGTAADIFGTANSSCLKGIAIIMLLFHHCFLDPDRYEGQTLTFLIPEAYINYIAAFFKICVAIFVFVSAYGLTKKMMSFDGQEPAALRKSISRMLRSRLIKLLGSFIFVFLLLNLASLYFEPDRFFTIYGREFPDAIEYFIIDMLGLAQLLGTPTYIATFWYYSLAIVLILILPAMYLLYRKTGPVMFLAVITVINFTVTFNNRNIWHYVLCIAVGIVCAGENLITKAVNYQRSGLLKNKVCKFAAEALLLFLLMILREGALKGELYPFWDAVIPMVLTMFCCEFMFPLPVIRQILDFLGKYSANIFLVHNFIRVKWFYDFTYSFKEPFLITLVLLLISLVLSILIEQLKKLLHFNQLLNRLIAGHR